VNAGDLCEIVDHPHWFIQSEKKFIGWHVVLIKRVEIEDHILDAWKPRWFVSGIPVAGVEVSEKVLRKLPPPPPLEDDIPTLTDVVESA
jgi:hypothetical protein